MSAASIQHVFVLMMENRSFDHLLAFSALPGVAPPDPGSGILPSAVDRAPLDPPHEFEDVQNQIAGGGVRVPAVAISPWIAPGLGSQRFPGQTFRLGSPNGSALLPALSDNSTSTS